MGRPLTLLLLAMALAATLILTGCGGGTLLLGVDDEVKIGTDAANEFDSENPVDRTSPLAQRVSNIGLRMAAHVDPPAYPYSFTLVRDDTVNAFAFPGGRIYIYEGLINEVGNDTDAIAWVMAHEVTHIQQRHSAKAIERAIGATVLIQIALGEKTAGQVAGLGAGLAMQSYSREHEFTADRLGIKWTQRAGYDPTASVMVLETFQRLQGEEPSDFEIMFMTHPGNNDRINAVKRSLDTFGYSGAHYTAGSR